MCNNKMKKSGENEIFEKKTEKVKMKKKTQKRTQPRKNKFKQFKVMYSNLRSIR